MQLHLTPQCLEKTRITDQTEELKYKFCSQLSIPATP